MTHEEQAAEQVYFVARRLKDLAHHLHAAAELVRAIGEQLATPPTWADDGGPKELGPDSPPEDFVGGKGTL